MPSSMKAGAGWAKTGTSALQDIMVFEHWTGFPTPTQNTVFKINQSATNVLFVGITDPGGNSGVATSTTISLNTWFHWAFSIDTIFATISVWLNGAGKGTTGYTQTPQIWRRHSVAAGWAGANPFNGQMAHVAAWGAELRDAEVLALYEGRCPPMDVGVQTAALKYYAPLDHDDLCQFGEGSAGAQLVFGTQGSPTFSTDGPRVVPMLGGIVAA